VRIPKETDTAFAPKPPPAPKTAPKAEAAPAPQPAASEYVIQVGAFARPDSVTAKLKAAKLPYYTEPMPGNLTRVRAGPFASREAADQALAKLKELGLKPGAVTSRSG
jgi:DedD protein